MSFAVPSSGCHMLVMCSGGAPGLAADPTTEFGAPGARVEVLRRIDGPFSSVQRVRIHTPALTLRLHQGPEAPPAGHRGALAYRPLPETRVCCDGALYGAATGRGHRRRASDRPASRNIARSPPRKCPAVPSVSCSRMSRRPQDWLERSPGVSADGCAVCKPSWKRAARSRSARRRAYLDDRLKLLEGGSSHPPIGATRWRDSTICAGKSACPRCLPSPFMPT